MQKILIVEDNVDIQDILKNHLIDAGYKAIVASDGVAGIAMFDDTIDLVLLDIMLPKLVLFIKRYLFRNGSYRLKTVLI